MYKTLLYSQSAHLNASERMHEYKLFYNDVKPRFRCFFCGLQKQRNFQQLVKMLLQAQNYRLREPLLNLISFILVAFYTGEK